MQVLSVHRSVLLIGIIISLAIPFAVIKPAQAMTDQTPAPGNTVPPNIYIPYISGVSQPTPPGQTSAVRAVRVQYTDYAKSQTEAPAIEAHLRSANVNLVGLSAGRVEWTYLDWKDHPELVASSTKDSGTDILAADSNRYSHFAQINAVIDVFSPNYILAHPDKAAINALGQRNPNLVGTMELVDGQYGQLLIQLVTYIASNYPHVDSISLTELSYRLDGYGPSELASYQAYSGNKDWARQPNGQIEIDNSSIGNWRSHVMDVYLDKLVAICHAHGKKFFMDVQLSWNNLSNVTNEDGTNYDLMLQHIDKLIVWGYYYLKNYPPEFLQTVASFLSRYGSDHVIMSIGMWGPNNTSMPADLLARGIQASIRGGLTEIWITPSIMLDDNSWNVIQQAWAGPP